MDVGKSLAGVSSAYGNNMSSLAMAQGQNQANNINQIGNAIGGGVSRIGGVLADKYGSSAFNNIFGGGGSGDTGKYGTTNTKFTL
jgi:hypothetical protein